MIFESANATDLVAYMTSISRHLLIYVIITFQNEHMKQPCLKLSQMTGTFNLALFAMVGAGCLMTHIEIFPSTFHLIQGLELGT